MVTSLLAFLGLLAVLQLKTKKPNLIGSALDFCEHYPFGLERRMRP